MSWGYVGLNAGTITIAGIGGEYNSAVSLSGSFEILNPHAPAFLQLEVRSYGFGQSPDAEYVRVPLCFPGDGTCASVDRAKIRALRQAKETLKNDRRKMVDAVEQLEDRNDVFCSVSGYLLGRLEPHEAVEKGWDEACGRIPDLVKAYVDADKKLDRNAELIRKLEKEINRLEGAGRAEALSSSLGASGLGWPTAPLAASRAGGQDPLAALNTARKRALAGIGSLSEAIGKGKLNKAKGLARTAASKLKTLPEPCSAAKRYLKKNGLGTRFSRAKILHALRRLKTKPLPPRVARFAKALHLSKAKMKRLVRKAKSAPKAHVKAMGFPI